MEFFRATKLLSDLKSTSFLPKFNTELFNQMIEDQDKISKDLPDIYKQIKDDPEKQIIMKPYISMKLTEMKRNKRIQLAYLNHRLSKIEEQYWKQSGMFTHDDYEVMNGEEMDYAQQYANLIKKYESRIMFDGDLSKGQKPPAEVYIQVRVIKPIGLILTSDGDELDLQVNAQQIVKRSDVEQFLLDGSVIQV